jgi:hypothetical protein
MVNKWAMEIIFKPKLFSLTQNIHKNGNIY